MKRIKLTNYFTEATTIVMIDHIALIEPHQHNNEATGVLTLKGSILLINGREYMVKESPETIERLILQST